MLINGFRLYKPTTIGPDLEPVVLSNSITFKQGQAVKLLGSTTVAALDLADAVTDYVWGIIEAFVAANGLPLSIDTTLYDGTLTEAPTGDTYLTSSDNRTDKKITAMVRPVGPESVLSALLNAAVGTTTGSDLAGNSFGILTTDCTKLAESTVLATTTANTSYISIPNGVGSTSPKDPSIMSTTRILVKVTSCQRNQLA